MLFLLLTTLGVCQGGVALSNKVDRVSSCRFTLFKEPMSREAAAEVCHERGVLAEIRSQAENEEVVQLLSKLRDQQKAWIGLSYASNEWRWDTGSQLFFSKLSGEDSLTSTGLDTYITRQGQWNISTVKQLLPFVCRMNGDYMAFTTPVTRNAAKRHCQTAGMTLAAVQKKRQIKAVKSEIRATESAHLFNWFWLGGRDAIAQGDWLWEDESPVVIGRALKWEYGVIVPREGPLYLAFNKITGRVRALHEQFKNPYVCRCPEPQEPHTPQMQSDYGSINSYGKYVPLFRKNLQKNRARVDTGFQSVKTALLLLTYKFINKVVTHGEAERYCQGMGGHLACPRNSLQQNLIKETIRGNAWLGVVDVDEEQVYTCIGEEGRALTYTNWYQRFGIWAIPEPDNMTDRMKPGASYVQILYDSLRSWRHGKWIDRGSPQYEYVVKSAFVCELSVKN